MTNFFYHLIRLSLNPDPLTFKALSHISNKGPSSLETYLLRPADEDPVHPNLLEIMTSKSGDDGVAIRLGDARRDLKKRKTEKIKQLIQELNKIGE